VLSEVVWDEGEQDMPDQHGLLKKLALGAYDYMLVSIGCLTNAAYLFFKILILAYIFCKKKK
jgi:hypothetical protein